MCRWESAAAVYTVQRRNPEGQPIPAACTAERYLALARTESAGEAAFRRAETVLERNVVVGDALIEILGRLR